MSLFVNQLLTLLWKSWIFTSNNWVVTLIRALFGGVCIVLFGILLLFATSGADENPVAYNTLGPIPKCQPSVFGDPDTCVTLIYNPSTNQTDTIMSIVASKNGLQMGTDVKSTNLTLPEFQQSLLNYDNQNFTQGGIFFLLPTEGNLTLPIDPFDIRYTVVYNGTTFSDPISFVAPEPYMNYQFQMQNSVDGALVEYFTGFYPDIELSFKPFPTISNPVIQGLIYASVEVVIFLATSLPFIFVVMQVNNERESGQRGYMKLVGLKDLTWWIATAIDHSIYYIALASILLIAGYLWYPWMAYFWNCSIFVHIFYLLDYGFAMYTMAILITTLIRDKKFVVIVGFCVLVFGLAIAFTIMFSDSGIFGLWNPDFVDKVGPWGTLLSFFPPMDLVMIILWVKLETWGYVWFAADNDAITTGFTVSDLYSVPDSLLTGTSDNSYVPTANYFMLFCFFNGLLYLLLAIYFDQVMPDPYRAPQPWLYFLYPSYWGLTRKKPTIISDEREGLLSGTSKTLDEDVEKEIAAAKEGNANLRIDGLVKIFKGGWMCFTCSSIYHMCKCGSYSPCKPDTLAVNKLFLTAEDGTLLCLLGHNGAGKTTTINMLTGITTPSAGQAFIEGLDVDNDIEKIREFMGYCPQFDILWNDLSARQHLYLISGLKREGWKTKEHVDTVLDDVRLLGVADRDSKTFSGGMKRRLSLAMSIVTDPSIVFMDEPTTGMDPGNRRHIWETILKIRVGRLVVLTTHSMEEADVLGEKIAIIGKGGLVCVGNSLHLKNKYGVGYRLSLIADERVVDEVIETVHHTIPESTLLTRNANSLVYGIPASCLEQHADAFASLQTRSVTLTDGTELPLVLDWSIANSSLEDVFIQTTRHLEDH